MLGMDSLAGKSFIDVGSGSGLFSLAARQLGARVRSFDYDPSSVACAQILRERFYKNDTDWVIEEGSALDANYMQKLGRHDIVYSWGVLHHTGDMWKALANVGELVADKGLLFIAIYNDQGGWSRRWRKLKQIYNRLPAVLRIPYLLLVMGIRELRSLLGSVIRLHPLQYIHYWTRYASHSGRGMSRWRDMVDWMGGYPFEVAKPEEIFKFYRDRGFQLVELATCSGGLGCNQYVFRRGGR
ncbi:MAG: class I SAM-dependent methyltransferase [Gammaproteobacteria bacterium]|nr:class I SAM-dependent methyltransferase [Gammaproteobacteria bacterium]MDE2344826.1 class I SAM-dependent methyltransferase [Gammaproteobacteria bacterium]